GCAFTTGMAPGVLFPGKPPLKSSMAEVAALLRAMLSQKRAAHSAFAMQGNPMLAMRRHFVSVFFHELLVRLHLLLTGTLLQIPDSHFTIEVLQQPDVFPGEESFGPLLVANDLSF